MSLNAMVLPVNQLHVELALPNFENAQRKRHTGEANMNRHRAKRIKLENQAISEVQAGMACATIIEMQEGRRPSQSPASRLNLLSPG
jgi:hypothetical protein